MSFIYKICKKDEWTKAIEKGFYIGSEVDIKDGYIHFSTQEQLKETLEKHFKGQANLIIISFRVIDLADDLRWELARNNDLFPHYYGKIDAKRASTIYPLELGVDGIQKFPKNFFS